MNIVMFVREPLILRDGRPFGEHGTVRAGALQWPMPSTLAGMIRSRIGLSRNPLFFQEPDAVNRIRTVHIECIQPVCRIGDDDWRFVYPQPADLLVCNGQNETLSLHGFDYAVQGSNGVTLPWKNWLIPLPQTQEKPARPQPAFWHESIYMKWLTAPNTMQKTVASNELGWHLPHQDQRIHCCIDKDSGSAADGQLWMSSGLCMQGYDTHNGIKQWGIAMRLGGYAENDTVIGPAHLGGDRRLAWIENMNMDWPDCPDSLTNARYLRLVLTTSGSFGGWAPDWLLPQNAANQTETPWVTVPGTAYQVRICSAFIPRWVPVSGWNYATSRPKAMRKLVPAGAVYVIEVEKPETSQEIARHLWGHPLISSEIDGYGICLVGRADINTQQERR